MEITDMMAHDAKMENKELVAIVRKLQDQLNVISDYKNAISEADRLSSEANALRKAIKDHGQVPCA